MARSRGGATFPGVLHKFSDAMAMTQRGDGRFVAAFDRSWWVVVGPNGGVIAALLLRAAQASVAPDRSPRTITVHYVRPPVEGEVEMEVSVDRTGRTVSFVSVRMLQSDRLVASAMVALATARDAPIEWEQRSPPQVRSLAESFMMEGDGSEIPIRDRWDQAWAVGVPGQALTEVSGGFEAGGWLRLADPEPYDAAVIAAMSDAWVPAVMVHSEAAVHTPTLELTVHFRRDIAEADLDPNEHCCAVFRQHSAHEGFLDESGEIWSEDGRLLAMCRQMGLVLPRPPDTAAPGRRFRPRQSANGR